MRKESTTLKGGLWIDHRRALIYFLTDGGDDIHIVESDIQRRPRATGGSPSITPYGAKDAVAEDRLERKYKLHLSQYYDDVLAHLKDLNCIYLMGPGQAKVEFVKHVESKAPSIQVVEMEAAERMTDPQFRAKVRNFFCR